MPFAKFIFKLTPEYQDAYQNGFDDAKRLALDELKLAEKRIKQLEAFNNSTSTSI